ncbi:MAG TPA: hypothetical protein PLL72_16680, partial [Burkholderiaceae bacterium]|nr:hypothetical protein [Burkholderiaceae bacterium]
MTARTLQTGRTVRILADDLTGALDSATAFIGLPSVAGVPVVLDAAGPWPDAAARVAAVSTGSRDAPLADLPGLLQLAEANRASQQFMSGTTRPDWYRSALAEQREGREVVFAIRLAG